MNNSTCTGGNELHDVVTRALEDGTKTTTRLGDTFAGCAASLRLGSTNGALTRLQQAIGDLSLLAEFVAELVRGLRCLGHESGFSPDWRAFAAILKDCPGLKAAHRI